MITDITFPDHLVILTDKIPEHQDLAQHLESENYKVHLVNGIPEAIQKLNRIASAIVLMDISDNESACLEFCRSIKSSSRHANELVIVFSNKNDGISEAAAFRAGADDFLLKPLQPIAFSERLKARRKIPKEILTVQSGGNKNPSIHIDRQSYTAYSDHQPLALSKKEFELLYLFASQPGKIFSREEVYQAVWRKKMNASNRTVDVHILRLRKKIGHEAIQTKKGVGYRLMI